MRTVAKWCRRSLAGTALLGAFLILAQMVGAQQPGGPILPSMFSGGAGAFSGRLNTGLLGFRGMPSLDYFPGSSMPTIRSLSFGTIPNGPGVSATDPFGAFYANPMAWNQPGSFGAPLSTVPSAVNLVVAPSQIAVNPNATAVVPVNTGITAQPATQELVGAPETATIIMGTPTARTTAPVGPRVNVPVLNALTALATSTPPATQPSPGPLKPRDDLQQVIARSSALSGRDSIQVLDDGAGVVLRGTVIDDHDRRMAEALVRLTPGVQVVRNELTVR